MTILDCNFDDPMPLLRQRTIHRDAQTEVVVKEIVAEVRQRGDAALLDSARRFDAPGLESLEVTQEEIDAAMPSVEQALALDEAVRRVLAFHEDQLFALTAGLSSTVLDDVAHRQRAGHPRHHAPNHAWSWKVAGGTSLGQRIIPVRSAGVYVPGGNATYPSSVVMNAVPAQVAGVNRVVLTTPARPDGTLASSVLYAARYCGIAKIVKVGGAAAIAALALGTESIARVDKIVGPGNRFVNEAKRQLWGTVGLDGYAGPSEVCVLADETADARFAAADLLTQIEHAPDNAGFLVTLSRAKADEILAEVERQLQGAPREATMRAALENESLVLVARDLAQACDLVDRIAPEHLSLIVRNPEQAMDRIRNAGCILLGEYTPESVGDFCLGPSHTLPTSGAARFGSPVNVLDFVKVQSVANLTREELAELRPTIEAFGTMEGFPAHARGATIRYE
jgi:histidinol dehydrogenase